MSEITIKIGSEWLSKLLEEVKAELSLLDQADEDYQAWKLRDREDDPFSQAELEEYIYSHIKALAQRIGPAQPVPEVERLPLKWRERTPGCHLAYPTPERSPLNMVVEYEDELVILEHIGEGAFAALGDSVSRVILPGGRSRFVPTEKLKYGGIPVFDLIDGIPNRTVPDSEDEVWYHEHYGPVKVIAKYGEGERAIWRVVALGEVPMIYDANRAGFDVNPDEEAFESNPGVFADARTYDVYPCELFVLEDLIAATPKSDDWYVAQGPAGWDSSTGESDCQVDTPQHFVQVIADLPKSPVFNKDGTPKRDHKGRIRYESPKVLVRDEAGRYFITPAGWLYCINRWEEINGEKKPIRYKWRDPLKEQASPFNRRHRSGGNRDVEARVGQPGISEESGSGRRNPATSVSEILKLVNKNARYWKPPYIKFADLGLEVVSLDWSGVVARGKLIATVYLRKGMDQYRVPVYLSENGKQLEIRKFRCSQEAKDVICRFVSLKYAERKLLARTPQKAG